MSEQNNGDGFAKTENFLKDVLYQFGLILSDLCDPLESAE